MQVFQKLCTMHNPLHKEVCQGKPPSVLVTLKPPGGNGFPKYVLRSVPNQSVNSADGKSIPNTSVNKAVENQSPNKNVNSGVQKVVYKMVSIVPRIKMFKINLGSKSSNQ